MLFSNLLIIQQEKTKKSLYCDRGLDMHGGSMDNFWNCTLHPLFVLATLGSVFEEKKAKILSQQEKQRNICG